MILTSHPHLQLLLALMIVASLPSKMARHFVQSVPQAIHAVTPSSIVMGVALLVSRYMILCTLIQSREVHSL